MNTDFYGNPIRNENDPPDLGTLQIQGIQLNAALNDAWHDYDVLSDEYPALKDKIQKARNAGFSDDQIDYLLKSELEPRLNFFANPNVVNLALGRTPETQQNVADYRRAKSIQSLAMAFPDKSYDDIDDAIAVSQVVGINPHALLGNDNLMKAAVDGRKLRETWLESLQRGKSDYFTKSDISALGMDLLNRKVSRDDALRQYQELSQKFTQEPLNQSFMNRMIHGATDVTIQGGDTLVRGALLGAGLGTMGGVIGLPAGMSAPLAKFGWDVGMTVGAFKRMFELQAGADMLEFAQMLDENGVPIDEDACRNAAIITGCITAVTEVLTVKEAMKFLPGANLLFDVGKKDIQRALLVPSFRKALANIVIDTSQGIGWSTLHNVIETLGSIGGHYLAKEFSGQPFPNENYHVAQRVYDTVINSLRDFTGAAIPKVLFGIGRAGYKSLQYNRQVNALAQQTGLPVETVHEAMQQVDDILVQTSEQQNSPETQAAETQPVENQQAEIQTAETQPAEAQQGETQPTETQPVENQQEETQQGEKQQEQLNDYDYIFLPRDDLQTFINDHPDFQDLNGIITDNEFGITPEQYERISSAYPDFIAPLLNDIRYGSNGVTMNEAKRKIISTNPNEAQFFHSEENQTFIQRQTKVYLDNGVEEQDAQDFGMIWGAFRTSIHEREGITIPDPIINQQQEAPQVDHSRLSTKYDINNPDTWPDRERAEKFKEAVAWGKLPEAHSLVQNIFDYLRGKKPERADELQPQSEEVFKGLKQEAPDKVKSTRNDLAKRELDDYRETLRLANLDTINSLNLKDNPDPTRYEFNSQFPKGKSKHPTEQYYFGNFDGETRIDVATDGTDLKVRIKTEGNRDTAIFAIKNYRSAVLADVIRDVLGGVSIDGLRLSETPAAMYLSQALRSFWDKFGLRKANINTTSYTPNLDVQTEHLPVDAKTAPSTARSSTPDIKVQSENYIPETDSVTEHYDLPVDYDTLRSSIQVQSVTDFNHSEAPNAESYTPAKGEAVSEHLPVEAATKIQSEHMPVDLKLDVQHLPLDLVPPSPNGPDYDRDNSVVFDEENYSPDFEHNEAVLQDIPEQHVPDYETVSPETKRENMPDAARFKLAQDEQAWHKTVDSILADEAVTTRSLKQTPVMMTPLVLTLVGAKHTQMNINNGKLKLILRDHKGMTPDVLKDIPRSITDPTAIFESTTRDKSIIILTGLKDDNGVEVLTAVNLNQRGEINKIDSAYSKSDKKGNPKYSYYQDLAVQGNLLYLNRQKAALWAQSSGVDLSPYAADASTEADLISLWNKHKENGYYYTDKNGNPIAFTTWKHGRAVIDFIRGVSNPAHVHEMGHAAFYLMQALEKQGSVGMRHDIDIILKHAGVSREAFDADVHRAKGGAKEIAQEYFAKAFETYLAEGKAPNKTLQPVFTRIRNWMIKIYGDIQSQLGIELDDEVRAVFDRLLFIPDDGLTSLTDIALHEKQLETQISAYEAQIRDIRTREAENLQAQLQLEADPHMFDIDEKAAQNVDEIINLRDWYSTIADEMQAQKENIDYIVAAVKQAGRISYQSIEELAGKAKADEIYSKWGRQIVFKNSGIHIDDVQGRVEHTLAPDADVDSPAVKQFWGENSSNHGLLDFLDNNSPIRNSDIPSSEIPAHHQVDTNLVNALLAAEGVDTTVDYLEHRKSRLENEIQTEQGEAEITEIDSWLAKFKAAGSLDEELSNPSHRSRKKQSISKKDLRQAVSTAAKMGQQLERLKQDVKAFIKNERLQKRFDEKIQALKQAREADRAKHKERLERITQALQDRADNKLQKKQQQAQRKIQSLQQRIDTLRASRSAKQQKDKINRMVKAIARMSKRKNISVQAQDEIHSLLEGYNLSRKGITQRDLIRSFFAVDDMIPEEQLNQMLEENEISREDFDNFLNTINIEDMTIDDVSFLHQQVSQIYQQGRRDYQIWREQKETTRKQYNEQLMQDIKKLPAPDSKVIIDRDDVRKQYKHGKVGELVDSFWTAAQTPGKFLEGLGENFRGLFEDKITKRRDKADSFIYSREANVLEQLKHLGFSLLDFAKPAITIDGQTYSWENVHAIWLAFKNEKAKNAVLWGNFIQNIANPDKKYASEEQAMKAINQMFQLMHDNPRHIQAAQLIIQDFDNNFQRLHDAGAKHHNENIHHEDNYTPLIRLQYQSSQGVVDAQNQKIIEAEVTQMQKVENGFTQSRVETAPMQQQPVDLHVWANWMNAVKEQEYYINFEGYDSDLKSALLMRGDNGYSVADIIKSRLGNPYWDTLRSIFNDSITDRDVREFEAGRSIAEYISKARSYAYLGYRLVNPLLQFSSYFHAIKYTNSGHLMRSLATFIKYAAQGKANEFFEQVYQKAPELRYTGGDMFMNSYQQELRRSKTHFDNHVLANIEVAGKKVADHAFDGIRIIDSGTKALVFHAVYEAMIEKGLSEEEAIRLANRAVRDTQPASTARESTRLNKATGWTRVFLTQFMAPLAPVFNMTVVDTVRAFTSPSWNKIKSTAWGILGVSLGLIFTQGIRDLLSGKLPYGEEDDKGVPQTLDKWAFNSVLNGWLNSWPIFNSVFDAIGLMGGNNRHYNNQNPIVEPFVSAVKAADYFFNPAYEGEYSSKGWKELIKALGLFGIGLPFGAFNDVMNWFFSRDE